MSEYHTLHGESKVVIPERITLRWDRSFNDLPLPVGEIVLIDGRDGIYQINEMYPDRPGYFDALYQHSRYWLIDLTKVC